MNSTRVLPIQLPTEVRRSVDGKVTLAFTWIWRTGILTTRWLRYYQNDSEAEENNEMWETMFGNGRL